MQQKVLPSQMVSPEKILGRSLPSSIEAERAVLGALLFNDERLVSVVEALESNDFYDSAHRIIFEVMIRIAERKGRLDTITLHDELQKHAQLDAVGGMAYIVSLQEDIPAVGLLEQHVRIIKDKAVLRALIGSATTIISSCYSQNNKEIELLLDEAERTIFSIAAKRSLQNFVQLTIWLKKTFQRLSEIKGHSSGITGIPAGYKMLDQLTAGFQKGDLIVLAARPSMGKTALALNLASSISKNGFTVGFFSLEMSAEQLTLRLVSSESSVPHQHIRNATLNSNEWLRLTHTAGLLSERAFFIDDSATQSIMDVRTKARKLKFEHNLQFLIIDYLQLIHTTRSHENRHQEVAEISRSLKALAKELDIPILALSQLSRAVDSRIDKRPMLSDLRESGAIEQDADLIMFLYREVVYNEDAEDPHAADVIVSKQRNGPTGIVPLYYRRDVMLFEDV
jgi:replicative DNA helicase